MTNVQYDLKFEITYFYKHYGILSLAKEYIFNVRYFSGKLKIKSGFSEKATKFEKNFVVLLTRASCSVHVTSYLSKS